MKRILITLLMLAPMTVAAEGMIMLEHGDNVRGVSRSELGERGATKPEGPMSPGMWDEVQKRRMNRAFDALMRHLVFGPGVMVRVAEENTQKMESEGRSARDVAIADTTIRIAGMQMILDAAAPYRSDLRGHKIEPNKFNGRGGVGAPTISLLLGEEKNSEQYMDLIGDVVFVTEDTFSFYESLVEKWIKRLNQAGIEYDPNSPYATQVREALAKRLPPRDSFKLN